MPKVSYFKVDDEAAHKGKPYWANFKRTVYHKCVEKILESITFPSCYGMLVSCADRAVRRIFPFIQDISADTEEA